MFIFMSFLVVEQVRPRGAHAVWMNHASVGEDDNRSEPVAGLYTQPPGNPRSRSWVVVYEPHICEPVGERG
jgi:hypothetical protein